MNVITGIYVDYVSEVTGKTFRIFTKGKTGRKSPEDAIALACGYKEGESICGTGGVLFKPRLLKVQYEILGGKETISYIVDKLSAIPVVLAALETKEDVACVFLEGERWGAVPNTQGEGSYVRTNGKKKSFVFDYKTDLGLGVISLGTAFEEKPDALFASQVSCVDNINFETKCRTPNPGIKYRRAIGKAINSFTGGSINASIPVSDPAAIGSCINTSKGPFDCIGYEGEGGSNVLSILKQFAD